MVDKLLLFDFEAQRKWWLLQNSPDHPWTSCNSAMVENPLSEGRFTWDHTTPQSADFQDGSPH